MSIKDIGSLESWEHCDWFVGYGVYALDRLTIILSNSLETHTFPTLLGKADKKADKCQTQYHLKLFA